MAPRAPIRSRQRTVSAAAAGALVLLASPAAVGAIAGGDAPRAQPTQLRVGTASSAPEADDATIRRVAASLGLMRVPEDGRAPEEKKKQEGSVPVSMQVPEKEIKALAANLTRECGEQFDDILHGRSQLHTFGDSGRTTKGECAKLHGSLCSMHARLTQAQAVSGRSIESTTHVSGDSCLPDSCMSDKDLQVLAEFMKLKAKDSVPGGNIDITMRVDCTGSGGGSVGSLLSATGAALPRGAVGGGVAEGHLSHRSSAAIRAPGILAALVAAVALLPGGAAL
mmetsp:Transcript_56912/g.112093  ORF Transcript_56912/g.112093 Transcript_56912/m.112093 type:complete len:281 (-) Transcript_56912:99-941(-)